MSNQMKYSECWFIKCYSKLNSDNELQTLSPNTEIRVVFLNRSLNVFINEKNESIHLKPEMYILYLDLYIGILSFELGCFGKWVLSFHDKESAINCVETLESNGIKVTCIQKLLSEKICLENAIIEKIKNVEFPHFVAKVENAMKKNKYN